MRLVVLYQGETLEDHPGSHEGFQRLQSEGILADYRAIPYYGFARDRGWPALWDEAERQVRAAGADAVFLQFFHGPIPDPTRGIAQLRSCPSCPNIFTSLGDPFGLWLNPVPSSFRIASRLADLNFMTGMGKLAQGLARLGTKNLVLMPNGACQKRFAAPLNRNTYQPEFDVVFIGSRLRSRRIIRSASWFGFWRDRLVAKLTRRFGGRFGLFGDGWEGYRSWQGAVPYDRQHEALHRSRVQIGGYPGCLNDYYTSDRVHIALASGIPFVDYWVPGVECFFQNGTEWWLGRTLNQMVDHVEKLLEKPQAELLEIGETVRQEILAHHTQYHRCQQMIEIVGRYRECKQAGKQAEIPALRFLRFPSVSGNRVGPAVINWQG
jgi:hypothetical protein